MNKGCTLSFKITSIMGLVFHHSSGEKHKKALYTLAESPILKKSLSFRNESEISNQVTKNLCSLLDERGLKRNYYLARVIFVILIVINRNESGETPMRCPSCQYNGTRVVDSRPVDDNKEIRRRRECESCGFRFTTFEKIEETPLIVVKKEGTREEFSREKVLRGLIRACEKRPVALEELEELVINIEKDLRRLGNAEVRSEDVGEMVMDRLAKIDEVAYVRFASVYRQFKDLNVFIDELKELIIRQANEK